MMSQLGNRPGIAGGPGATRAGGKGSRLTRWVVLAAVVGMFLIAVGATALVVRRQFAPKTWPVRAPWPEKTELGLRQQVVRQREMAVARGDLVYAAELNSLLAQEALVRALAVERAWAPKQNKNTKLFPQAYDNLYWNYQNTAADFFGFMIHASLRLEPDRLGALRETIAAERALVPAGELCQPVSARTGEPQPIDEDMRMFGSTEYVKDGLLGVYEKWGMNQPSAERMLEVLDTIMARSAMESRFGVLPGAGSEENGNVLQACSRLGFATGRDAYAEFAARIADASIEQMLPANGGLPAKHFDYKANQVLEEIVQIRDHGNEVIPGLSEAYAMAVGRLNEPAWKERADRWAEPIGAMLEKLMAKARDTEGLLVSKMDPASFEVVDARPNDNWGYIANAVLLYTEAARKHGVVASDRLDRLEQTIDELAEAVSRQYGVQWERLGFDGYADTLESAMYTANHRPRTAARLLPWVDDQVGLLFGVQRPSGFVEEMYLDGNFIRTALLYADMRGGGWRVEPWAPQVRVGAAWSDAEAVIVVTADADYRGTLLPETDRHRTVMRLPWDWPRLNSWPEWVPVTPATAVASAEGLPETPTAEALLKGLPLSLKAGDRIVLRVNRVKQ